MSQNNIILSLIVFYSLTTTHLFATMRIMTFNYPMSVELPCAKPENNKKKGTRRKLARKLLKNTNPDIIGFQEVHLGDIEYFHDQLKEYEWIGEPIVPLKKRNLLTVMVSLNKAGTDYNPIFYRPSRFKPLKHGTFWLNEGMNPGEPSDSWKIPNRKHYQIRACTYAQFKDLQTKKIFWAFNTHLSLDKAVVAKELELIGNQIGKKTENEPVFFFGDLNLFIKEKTISTFGGTSFFNPVIGGMGDRILTAHMPHDVVQKYEWIIYKPLYEKKGIVPSDHRPVYLDATVQ